MFIKKTKKAISVMLSLSLVAYMSPVSSAADLVPVNNDLHVPFQAVAPQRVAITDFSIQSFEAKVKNILSPNKTLDSLAKPVELKAESDKPNVKTLADEASGDCGDGVTYSFVADTGTLTISGSGEMPNYYSYSSVPWDSYRDSITSVKIENGVTSIGNYAFYGCSSLTGSLIIPNSVTSIGGSAFRFCSGLTSVTIPNSVTSIGGCAFDWCSKLTSVTIPSSVTSIGIYAFRSCDKLTSINVDGNNSNYKSIGGILYSKYGTKLIQCPGGKTGAVSIPSSVTSIESDAFSSCSGLTSVTIPNSVTSIGGSAFSSCSGLTSVIIPNSVTSIGGSAFSSCSGLTSVALPNSVTEIGISAFYNCSGLTSVIYSGTSDPGASSSNVFYDCNKLTEVKVPTNYSSSTFCGKPASKCLEVGNCGTHVDWSFDTCSNTLTISGSGSMSSYSETQLYPWNSYRNSIKSIEIDDGVTSIGSLAFAICTNLESVKIPSSVTLIKSSAFSSCYNLISVELNNDYCVAWFKSTFPYQQIQSISLGGSISNISDNAFSGCNKLTSITIGNNVESIGQNAFADCSELTQISIPTSVSSISNSAFNGCSKLSAISVDENNSHFCSDDGILFNKDKTSLIRCPEGKSDIDSYTIPNSINSIDSNAFRNCKALTSITIPESVTNVGSNAFS